MIIRNKLDKVYRTGASDGVFFCILLLIVLLSYLASLIEKCENEYYHNLLEALLLNTPVLLIIIWIFLFLGFAYRGFSTTYVDIDIANKRIKHGTKLFGVISKGGKWTYLTTDMKLGLIKTKKNYRLYGFSHRLYGFYRGNYSVLPYSDLKIVLYNNKNKVILPVKKLKRKENAQDELKNYCELLELRKK